MITSEKDIPALLTEFVLRFGRIGEYAFITSNTPVYMVECNKFFARGIKMASVMERHGVMVFYPMGDICMCIVTDEGMRQIDGR